MVAVEKLVKKAYKNVPMYMRLGIDVDEVTVEELPVIDKEYVIKNEAGAISAESLMAYYRNDLIKMRTSGSTGKYMEMYWQRSDYHKSMLPLWFLRKKYYGILPEDKMCYFYTLNEEGVGKYNKLVRGTKIGYSKANLDMESLCGIYQDMLKEQPVWMTIQPSMAVLLCKCVEKYNLKPIQSLKYIEFTGEMLSEQVRKDVQETFDCKVANQYGANEFNSIAYECPCGNMHLMTSNVIVEVYKDGKVLPNGEEGELVITTKTNTAMPLVRYRLGDMGKIHEKQCECGNMRPVLELTAGRTSDWIMTSEGGQKPVYAIIKAIDIVNYMSEGAIKQFQIVQKGIEEFIIKLVIDEDEIEEFQMNDMEEKLVEFIDDEDIRQCDFQFEYYEEMFPDYIEDENGKYRGKFRHFIREV